MTSHHLQTFQTSLVCNIPRFLPWTSIENHWPSCFCLFLFMFSTVQGNSCVALITSWIFKYDKLYFLYFLLLNFYLFNRLTTVPHSSSPPVHSPLPPFYPTPIHSSIRVRPPMGVNMAYKVDNQPNSSPLNQNWIRHPTTGIRFQKDSSCTRDTFWSHC